MRALLRPIASALVLSGIGAALPAAAEQTTDDGWRFTFTPYVWAAGVQGHVGGRPNSPPIQVDVAFTDVFDKLSGLFVGKIDVGYDRFGLFADILYISVAGDSTRVGNLITVTAEAEVETTASTIAAYYRVYDGPEGHVDILAGARINSIGLSLSVLGGGGLGLGIARDATETWVDPVIGFQAVASLGGNWSLTGYADIGGFGVSSDSVWQLQATIDYRFNDWLSASAGYRYYSVDYQDGSFRYDVDLGGPYLGFAFDL